MAVAGRDASAIGSLDGRRACAPIGPGDVFRPAIPRALSAPPSGCRWASKSPAGRGMRRRCSRRHRWWRRRVPGREGGGEPGQQHPELLLRLAGPVQLRLEEADLLGLPDDDLVNRADREGRSPMDFAPDSPAVQATARVASRLLAWAESPSASELLPLVG